MPKILTPHRHVELTETQKKGIRAVQSELDRFYKTQLRAADILIGIDEIIRALQVPIQSPIGAPFHSSLADALIAVTDWQDWIRARYYNDLFPSLARSAEVRIIRADMERAA